MQFNRQAQGGDRCRPQTAAADLHHADQGRGVHRSRPGQEYFEERYRQRVLHSLSVRGEKLGTKLVANEQPA
jgi:hypothetical protein